MDLTAARSVLNRDLADLRNKRAERERAAGAARLQNGQPKPVKKEPKANGTAAEQSSQAVANAESRPQEVKGEPDAEQSKTSTGTALVGAGTTSLDAIDSMFIEGLGGSNGLELNSGVHNQPQGLENGTAMTTDGLLTDVAMIDGADFNLLGTTMNDDSTDISTLLPGLEKYVNQHQDNGVGNNGQAAAANVDDFDLDMLLEEMTGGGESSQGQGSISAADVKTTNAKADEASALTAGNDTSAAASANQASALGDNAPAEDAGVMDFNNESSFDIDFDGLTAGAPDGSTVAGGDSNLEDWFNFD